MFLVQGLVSPHEVYPPQGVSKVVAALCTDPSIELFDYHPCGQEFIRTM